MKTNQVGVALIKEFEKLELTAYRCPAGIWTIGYGHTGSDVYEGLKITPVRAETWLTDDLARVEKAITRSLKTETTANQFAAMVALCFNIGEGWDPSKPKSKGAKDGFRQSTVLKKHNANDQIAASRAFSLWNKGTNAAGELVELRGLTRRRAAEAALYLTPTVEEEVSDPQRTRASDVEPTPAQPPAVSAGGLGTGAGIATVALAGQQAVSQVNGVWSWLQEAGINPKIALAAFSAAVVVIVGWTLWRLLQSRRAQG